MQEYKYFVYRKSSIIKSSLANQIKRNIETGGD